MLQQVHVSEISTVGPVKWMIDSPCVSSGPEKLIDCIPMESNKGGTGAGIQGGRLQRPGQQAARQEGGVHQPKKLLPSIDADLIQVDPDPASLV